MVKAMGRLSDDREEIIRTAEMLRATVYDTTALCAEQEQSETELAEAARQLTEAIMRNASVALVFCLMDRYSCSSFVSIIVCAG